MQTFHERLRIVLAERGITQRMLAARTGLDITNICHLLHGRRAPTLKTMCKLLRALPTVDARTLILGRGRKCSN